MFSMKLNTKTILLLLLHVWLQTGLTNQQQFKSTYPFISKYFNDNCPGFVCDLSTLSNSLIDTIVDVENKQRMDYAKAKRITNLYRVFWDNRLAKLARRKVQMCLPATFDDKNEKYQIFDSSSISDIYPESSPIRLNPAAIQIVSGERRENFAYTKAKRIVFQTKFIDYYIALFYSNEKNFKFRGATTLMGCGYIFQQTNDSFIDRLLCAYGVFYLNQTANYVSTVGRQPCSNCTYFAEKYYSDSRKLAIDRLERWGCDYMYSSLCNDLNKRPIVRFEPSGFDCDNPKAGLDFDRPARLQIPRLADRPVEVPVPCWYITAPLGLIIMVILGFCFFHTITAAMTYYKYKKSLPPSTAK